MFIYKNSIYEFYIGIYSYKNKWVASTRIVTSYRSTHVPLMSNSCNHKAELADAGKKSAIVVVVFITSN